jgi:hypothetical protein
MLSATTGRAHRIDIRERIGRGHAPKSYASSTMGVKRSTVRTIASSSLIR